MTPEQLESVLSKVTWSNNRKNAVRQVILDKKSSYRAGKDNNTTHTYRDVEWVKSHFNHCESVVNPSAQEGNK